jgi:hypothetical protein
MVFTAGVPKFFASGVPDTGVPAHRSSLLTISRVAGGDTASPSQTGMLLLYRDGETGHEADTIQVNAK